VNAVLHPITGEVVGIVVRPGVDRFLKNLTRHGDVWLLTSATREHAENALRKIGRASHLIREIVSREDLYNIGLQVEMISEDHNLSEDEKIGLYREVKPILSPGYVFDDMQVGSWGYWTKSRAVGIGPERWIEVEVFIKSLKDRGGLEKAYGEFLRRENRAALDGKRRKIAYG
jgi:hypothetical protein